MRAFEIHLIGKKLCAAGTVRWQQRILRTNDQVQIKIVETQTVDKPEVLQIAQRDSRKYEKAHVRKMAKQFGWTIQTRARKTD